MSCRPRLVKSSTSLMCRLQKRALIVKATTESILFWSSGIPKPAVNTIPYVTVEDRVEKTVKCGIRLLYL